MHLPRKIPSNRLSNRLLEALRDDSTLIVEDCEISGAHSRGWPAFPQRANEEAC